MSRFAPGAVRAGRKGLSGRAKGVLMAVGGAGLWGVLGLPVRAAGSFGLGPVEISFVRCLISWLFCLAFSAGLPIRQHRLGPAAVIGGAAYGVLTYGLTFTAYNVSVARIPVAVSTTLMFLCPVWVLLGNRLLFGEKAPGRSRRLALLSVLGAALASGLFSQRPERLDPIGVAAGIFNGAGVALRLLLPRCLQKYCGGMGLQTLAFGAAAAVLACFSDFNALSEAFSRAGAWKLAAALLTAGLLCTLLANVLFVASARYISSAESSILASTEVVVGTVLGLLAFGERLTWPQLAGIFLVLVGAACSQCPPGRGSVHTDTK